MNNINRKKELRFLILKRLYELTDGSELKQLDKEEVEKEIDATPQEISDAWRYLKNEYLANPVNMAVRISHGGVIAIEKALSEPNSPTEYFPPVTNIINVKEMHGSVIQQGNTNSTQSVTIETTTINELNEFLEKVKKLYLVLLYQKKLSLK